MMRGLAALLIIAALIAAAVFLANHPGQVEIVWHGWEIETSLAILVAAAIAAALAVTVLLRLLVLVVRSPRALLRRRRERRREAGYRALTQGMVAVAAGEPQEAQRQARKADLLLADPPLTLLLSAQAAQLEGDEDAARRFFLAMLDRPGTAFLGLRGLLNQALRADDRAAARRLAERARELRPNTPWVVETLFDLDARDGRWAAARDTLAAAERRGLIPQPRARHHRGVLLYELAFAARQRGEQRPAMRLMAEAEALIPDLAAPAAAAARWLLDEGRRGAAAKAVERAWRLAPRPELAEVWELLHAAEPPLARFKEFERLAAANPAAREGHLAAAEAALLARLWGEAHRHLDAALAAPLPPCPDPPRLVAGRLSRPLPVSDAEPPAGPTRRLCLLAARLAEAEEEPAQMRAWFDRAVTALPDPRYVCADCAGESFAWQSRCRRCGSFDTLSWRVPTRPEPLPIAGEAGAPAGAANRMLEAPAGAAEGTDPLGAGGGNG